MPNRATKTTQKVIIACFILIATDVALVILLLVHGSNFALLNPKGPIASQQRKLIFTAVLLMLTLVIPVFIATFFIAWKYRAGNKKAKYTPDEKHSPLTTFSWWGILIALVCVLATLNWKSTHALDPYKPLPSQASPITIQVVSLRWKWLFIYPEQHIATVNFIEFANHTPINFVLTSDAPMNSFWIPQLGGQMYSMAGMQTQLHLMADEIGEYQGSAAEINGAGFAGMKFIAKSVTEADFNQWVQAVKQSPFVLNQQEYDKLVQASSDNPRKFYSYTDPNLFDNIMMKFMMPISSPAMHMHGMIMP
ncbi:MAG TPA: ubiquinol oxidase subunit II [Methylomirabilota bacterium]|nr:ubiquinol oxidase subunit II [Methylomirabilota bacterium]